MRKKEDYIYFKHKKEYVTHTHKHTHKHTRTDTHTHTYVHTYIHTHRHTYTHHSVSVSFGAPRYRGYVQAV